MRGKVRSQVRVLEAQIFSIKQYFIFYGKSINVSQIDNNKKYTYFSVLSFKKLDRSCFSMYQLYVQFID